MILRAMVDKVRKMFGQTPVVDMQPKNYALQYDPEWCANSWLFEHPKKSKPYNVKLAHRKSKSQKRNWKYFKKKGCK